MHVTLMTATVSWVVAFAAGSPSDGPDVAAAAEAYTHAQRAELASDFARAAEFYTLADGLAPSPEALRSAAKNRFAAGQHAKAATLAAALLERYPRSTKSRALANAILDEAAPELARLELGCDAPCVIASGGEAVTVARARTHVVFVAPGEPDLVASFGPDRQARRTVAAAAGVTHPLSFDAPVPPPARIPNRTRESATPSAAATAPTDRARRRLSPAYFAVGAAATAGLAAASIWSGVDVLSQRQAYGSDPTAAGFDRGVDSQLRTNVLIGVTAAVGVTTVLLAVFTDWRRAKQGRARARVRAGEVRF